MQKQELKISKSTKIGILYGGMSAEREVSLKTGNNCFNALQRQGYHNVELIDVGTDIGAVLKEKQIEIAFLALHGRYGEDGTMQGLLELMHIPYTGCGVLSSALAIDKELTANIMKVHDLPYPNSAFLFPSDIDKLEAKLSSFNTLPLIVKPVNEGSSVGLCKVDNKDELLPAVKQTIQEYGSCVVQDFIKGQEITVGVIARMPEDTPGNGNGYIALPILEMRPKSKSGLYDYEAKYTHGMTEFILPAELDESTTAKAQELALKAFKAMRCSGYARIDMLVDKQNNLYVLEINTLPGMTDTSDLPQMANCYGIGYDRLVERMLLSAGLGK